MKVLTLGQGFIANHLPYEKITERISPDETQIRELLTKYKPNVLINCIGYCGGGISNATNTIDDCEINKEKTLISNLVIPTLLANECYYLGIHFIHIGSGCIYFGESPNSDANLIKKSGKILAVDCLKDHGWKETDFANPKSYYSKVKYAGDLSIGGLPNVSILRIRMPVSSTNAPRNFINKIKNYRQIIDIPNSMTFTSDLTRCIDWCAEKNKTGIYHVVNPGALSAVDVMKAYQKYRPGHKFEVINEQELDQLTKAKRSNCLLDNSKLTNEGFQMTPSKEALENCMKKYFESN